MADPRWSVFTKEQEAELRYATRYRVSPSIIALYMHKPVSLIINKLRDMGLRRKKGFKEYDPDNDSWG